MFAEAYLATQKINQADEVWPGETVPIALIKQLSLPLTDMGVDGVYRTLDGAHHAYQVKFRSRRPALNWTELSTFMGLADRAVQKLVFTNCDDLPVVMNERRGFVCVRGSDLDRLTASDFEVIDRGRHDRDTRGAVDADGQGIKPAFDCDHRQKGLRSNGRGAV